jgi:hypothetical protein
MSGDRRNQLKAGYIAAATMLLLLILINLTVYSLINAGTERMASRAPELTGALEAQSRMVLSLFALVSLVYLVGVILAAILPHRHRPISERLEEPDERSISEEGEALDNLAEELEWAALAHDAPTPIREQDRQRPPL